MNVKGKEVEVLKNEEQQTSNRNTKYEEALPLPSFRSLYSYGREIVN
jgi:hypothetical protein